MPKSKNINIKYTNREFSTIKEDLVEFSKRYYSDTYKDFSKASFGSMVLDSVAYVGDILSYYIDYSVNESFLDTAIEFDNVRKHARALGYNFSGPPCSYGHITLYALIPSDSEGMAPNTSYLPTIRTGTSFVADNGTNFVLTEDVRFDDPKNEFVAARFDESTGKTTYFAVMARGLVQSGRFYRVERNIENTAFERFKRIRVNDNTVSQIMSVYDSEGNRYYEVDNLSQETIFKETTNPDALAEGVRSILKPMVVARRFVVEQDDTGTFLQFGYGSEEEDDSGLADPSQVALKMHGKNTISNFSFDPTKLISTNKLGISPSNTILTITYRATDNFDAAVPSNSINSISTLESEFTDESILDVDLVADIRNTMECTNMEAFTSLSQDISLEELKARAKSHYASQGRAVTKEDYESVIYNMPTKFGAIKRANVINDPSGGRSMTIYVISEDNDSKLSHTHVAVKNNIKNWLSRYKMINDNIEIQDAVILNFGIDFTVLSDNFFNTDEVLINCMNSLKDHFSDSLYIGEPLYITRIYEVLNKTDGVVDVKNVSIHNLSSGKHSSFSIDLYKIMSKDGTFVKTPKNVILELKYVDEDIRGTVL